MDGIKAGQKETLIYDSDENQRYMKHGMGTPHEQHSQLYGRNRIDRTCILPNRVGGYPLIE